ncbi:MAG TPA: hypothetical protein VFU21_10415 [Kofleriaceae bacterium]|nr:hypothetical protein [Kofleriaceae bacterium]
MTRAGAILSIAAVSAAIALPADAGPTRGRRVVAKRGESKRRPPRMRVVRSARLRRPARAMKPRDRMRRTLPRADHRGGIRQITGRDLAIGQTQFAFRAPADPFVDVLPDGRVQVWGTFENYLEFASLDDFLRGGAFEVVPIQSDESFADEASWDHLIHRWPDGSEVLYGGTMTPTGGRDRARWPADNWNRRIYAFTRAAGGAWVRRPVPLFNPVPDGAQPRMIGHAYGHHFKTVTRRVRGREVQETWLFHEEIVAEGPLRTEIFARKMLDPFTASRRKVKILGTEWEGQPIGRRSTGDLLVEGPRPFEARLGGEDYSFITFSSGDFNSDNYDIHFAWRKGDGIGPHTPYVDRAGGKISLRGFAADLKKRYGLSWVGRAHVIRDGGGQYWAVFHGVDKAIRPEVDYTQPNGDLGRFQRNIFAVPMEIRLGKGGVPEIELLPDPR